MAGAWLVSSPDFPAQVMADRVIRLRRHVFPVMNYEFCDEFMTLTEYKDPKSTSMNIDYSHFMILIQDSEYFYMFVSKDSACMIDKASVNPQEIEKLAKFIESKTRFTFRREKSLLAMNLLSQQSRLLQRTSS